MRRPLPAPVVDEPQERSPPPARDAAAQRTGTEEPLRSRERTAAVELEDERVGPLQRRGRSRFRLQL